MFWNTYVGFMEMNGEREQEMKIPMTGKDVLPTSQYDVIFYNDVKFSNYFISLLKHNSISYSPKNKCKFIHPHKVIIQRPILRSPAKMELL